MRTLSPFESMEWLKTLSSSKCKWRLCCLLKACNDWRHFHLQNADEDIVAFEGMQWLKTFLSSKCGWGSLSPFEGMQWLKTLSSSKCKGRSLSPLKACNDWRHFCLWNVCGLLYRTSPHATWLLTGRGSINVCTDNPWVSLHVTRFSQVGVTDLCVCG